MLLKSFNQHTYYVFIFHKWFEYFLPLIVRQPFRILYSPEQAFFLKPTRIIVAIVKHCCRNCLHKRIPRIFPTLMKAIGCQKGFQIGIGINLLNKFFRNDFRRINPYPRSSFIPRPVAPLYTNTQ